jgi:hypothetical protein
MKATISAVLQKKKSWREETKTCLVKVEANPEEKETVAEQREVPKEEAAVETIGALKKRYGDRHLAVGRRRQLKKRTKGDGGSRQKLAVVRKGMTRRAGVARRKGGSHNGPTVEQRRRKNRTTDSVGRGTSKGRTF